MKHGELLLAYYGDDFTGSTDAMEFLSRAGAKTALFIKPPTPEQLAKYEGLRAIGIAGMSRSMAPAAMEQELRPAFEALHALRIPHVHYKICSTFDSSPTTGSIGKAIEIGSQIFKAEFVPLLVAAPALGRYCMFGNLFARMGIGSKGEIYRLDRHPSISHHPVTPAHESDLRMHLSKQTSMKCGLMNILQIVQPEEEARETLADIIADGAEIVLFDGLYKEQMAGIGKLIDAYASKEKPLFSVGSSGIEMALGNYWIKEGKLQLPLKWPHPGKTEIILVISGSCSPVTHGQIAWATAKGFIEIILDTEILDKNDTSLIKGYADKAASAINEGYSVIVHTSNGAGPAKTGNHTTAKVYGTALGSIARMVADKTSIKRIIIAGGDTSGFAAKAMGIEALEMIAPLAPGAPLCKAFAPGSPLDGLQVNFKGGQVGSDDYFGMVLKGHS